jgi:hypothetical protein
MRKLVHCRSTAARDFAEFPEVEAIETVIPQISSSDGRRQF